MDKWSDVQFCKFAINGVTEWCDLISERCSNLTTVHFNNLRFNSEEMLKLLKGCPKLTEIGGLKENNIDQLNEVLILFPDKIKILNLDDVCNLCLLNSTGINILCCKVSCLTELSMDCRFKYTSSSPLIVRIHSLPKTMSRYLLIANS